GDAATTDVSGSLSMNREGVTGEGVNSDVSVRAAVGTCAATGNHVEGAQTRTAIATSVETERDTEWVLTMGSPRRRERHRPIVYSRDGQSNRVRASRVGMPIGGLHRPASVDRDRYVWNSTLIEHTMPQSGFGRILRADLRHDEERRRAAGAREIPSGLQHGAR